MRSRQHQPRGSGMTEDVSMIDDNMMLTTEHDIVLVHYHLVAGCPNPAKADQ